MRINLLVKGNVDTTWKAIEARQISGDITFVTYSEKFDTQKATIEISNDNFWKISQWFAESPEIIPGFGYPVGTLLHYSF